jgi:hypothetical protein
MVNISLTLYTKGFFGSVLKSPTQMESLSINNSVTNISRLGTFKYMGSYQAQHTLRITHCTLDITFVNLKAVKGDVR